MPKFPKDAPKAKVLRALESLGFQVVREKEHISMSWKNEDGTEMPSKLDFIHFIEEEMDKVELRYWVLPDIPPAPSIPHIFLIPL